MAQGKPRKTGEFFVYLYKRPDGSVFYVGKGTKRRALSVSPSRRKVGRKKSVAWRKSEAGQAHLKKLAKIGKEALHRERTATCIECGCEFSTKSAKARACSRLCEQRNRRRRQAEERHGA